MGLYQSSLRTALTTAALQSSRQQATYPLLVKSQPNQQPNYYSRGYHYESANHSVYVQMPEGQNQVVLPLHPSPFAATNARGQNQDPKLAFEGIVKESLGETFDPRLAGLCVDIMKDPDVIDSVLKNPAFQELVDELAIEASKSQSHLLHVPDFESSSESSPCQQHAKNELPPFPDTRDEEEEEEEILPSPPLRTQPEKEKLTPPGDNENGIDEEKEADKIAENVVGVVCGNCHQPLPRLDLSKENDVLNEISDDFMGDVCVAPPPSQNMDRVW
eukprot:CAMPEP_0201521676 /NCGR_PEP_ID=MMETSP0161_2-20130828/15558_1 /ASSEMBLY_ACC=CAM_ASM_000251 /TAXON_ID=180227 /ORGANISM="Neoparamoeba aestuarina, Strain SoJaBio B1-5/56/2" /LENGTH=273 /DNA_ID=CAMNT_0047920353 /DNA_START=27 /DNA_END=845 /DNA_ORIENTATION=-